MTPIVRARLQQMRKGARATGKLVPTFDELLSLLAGLEVDGFKCPACRRVMNWTLSEGRSTVVTIQHDRSGVIRLMCKGCNSRHHMHPGDSFYDLPADHKRCPACETTKPVAEFYRLKSGKLVSECRPCSQAKSLARYHKNPEPIRAKHREWLANNREQVRVQRREHQQANRAKITAYERARRQRRASA